MSIVTLTTDYGTRDHYVGAMKGVILGIAPKTTIIDITHDVKPHDIRHGAFVLWQSRRWFPRGTVHIVVVDPGVGSGRRILVGQYAGQYVVVPDNGLLTLLHRETPPEAMHVVENRRYFLPQPSATFHGRDIMAPVAAHLAKGVRISEFGPVTDRLEMLNVAHRAQWAGPTLSGSVLHVDGFGTLVTNIHSEQLTAPRIVRRALEVWVGMVNIGPIRSTFSDVPEGQPVALIGGAGLLEIAVNKGRAADAFGPVAQLSVEVREGGTLTAEGAETAQ